MPVPFYTIAARAMHVGRYGSGADDPRLPPLYVGYPTLVRGYDLSSRMPDDCVGVTAARCQQVDRMLGSRVAVGNIELRFPLLRPFGVSRQLYGPLPVEAAFFVDGGLAWGRGRTLSNAASSGSAASAGVTLRTNLFGVGVGQFDIARPLWRAGGGWTFQFNLSPPL
jgi:outer membrane protein assembly factor BamA